jgi:hypothetical protein
MTEELPEQIERQLAAEEARERASEERYRADMRWLEEHGLREPPQEPRSAAERFVQRAAEERRAEERRAARANELMHLNPDLPVADPLRQLAAAERARHRRARRRGRVP